MLKKILNVLHASDKFVLLHKEKHLDLILVSHQLACMHVCESANVCGVMSVCVLRSRPSKS